MKQPTSQRAATRTKLAARISTSLPHPRSMAPRPLCAALAACFVAGAAANPANPQVAAGNASFSQQGTQLTVRNSNNAIINWGSFSIGAGELTRFVQPDAASRVLNRVSGTASSQLLGQLLSNGQVFLINPNGIAVGAGARIDTAGFIASTLALGDADFMSGRLRFAAAGAAAGAGVLNQGVIHGNGGLVALIGSQVENSGSVQSAGGQIALAAGREVELLDAHSPHIRIRLSPLTSAAQIHRVLQSGVLSVAVAEGGQATGARVGAGGQVVLHAAGDTAVNGLIDARNAGGAGGSIEVLGQNVRIEPAAVIDAGGRVGGRVVVLADADAAVHGSLLASGSSGAGGFIETSGKRMLDVSGIRLQATGTTPGTWLLDPINIEVVAGSGTLNNGGATAFTPNTGNSQVGAGLIVAQLDAGTNVTLNTNAIGTDAGNIVVNAPIVATVNNTASLSLLANNNIVLNQPVTVNAALAGLGDATLNAGGSIAFNAPLTARRVMLTAGAGITRSGAQADDVVITGNYDHLGLYAADRCQEMDRESRVEIAVRLASMGVG